MRSITYCYVFHGQTAKLGPESVLMPFISCKGNHKPGAFPQSPATSSPKEFLPQNWDASSSGAFKRIHRVVGQSEAHRWQPTQSLGHIFIASFISNKAYLKAYFNISYFKHLLKFFSSVTCAGRAVPMEMSCYPTWFRPAEVPSGALGWERRRKKGDQALQYPSGRREPKSLILYWEFSEPRFPPLWVMSITSRQMNGLKSNAFLKSNNFYVLTG